MNGLAIKASELILWENGATPLYIIFSLVGASQLPKSNYFMYFLYNLYNLLYSLYIPY